MTQFDLIVMDPPWWFSAVTASTFTCESRNRKKRTPYKPIPYPLMTDGEIIDLDIRSLASRGCVLVLWCTAHHLSLACKCVERWGFTVKQVGVWHKVKKDGSTTMGLGTYLRNGHEQFLLCTTGSGARKSLACHTVNSVFNHKRTGHSKKPECIQDALEKMWPNRRRLEMFARRDRLGWTCVGNQCPSTFGEDIRDSVERLKHGSL